MQTAAVSTHLNLYPLLQYPERALEQVIIGRASRYDVLS